jgi:nitrate reductase gamma subunit
MSALKGEGHGKLAYRLEIFLWAGSLAFHYAMLVVVMRHMRFFMEPVPAAIQWVENLDGFFKVEILADIYPIGLPAILASGFVLFFALTFLLGRRVLSPMVRYVSLLSDYFPLLLLLGIAGTGILMRYFLKVDILGVKELTMGFATFRPAIPEGVGSLFYIHFFLVCVLIAYLPFSKIMHVAGVFLSPTRNLTADTRRNRHVNPWNPEVKTHTYEEYEDDFREKMAGVGLPLDKKES